MVRKRGISLLKRVASLTTDRIWADAHSHSLVVVNGGVTR